MCICVCIYDKPKKIRECSLFSFYLFTYLRLDNQFFFKSRSGHYCNR